MQITLTRSVVGLIAAITCAGAAWAHPLGVWPPPLSLRPSSGHAWLFVAGQANQVVNAYDLAEVNDPLVETIHTPATPSGILIDRSGNLWVSIGGSDNIVAEYPPGQTSPALTIPVPSPQSMAIDTRGYLYVSMRGSPPGIWVFKPGATTPLRKVENALFGAPSQIAFGPRDLLYITDNSGGVLVMKNNTYEVESLNLQDLYSCSTGIAIDEKAAEFYVSGCNGGTHGYAFGMNAPNQTLEETFPADNIAFGSVEGQGFVFAPDLFGSTVTFYDAGSPGAVQTLTTGSSQALGVALKPARVP